jgi:Fur family transcriptional regulator, ferric uptake regulator
MLFPGERISIVGAIRGRAGSVGRRSDIQVRVAEILQLLSARGMRRTAARQAILEALLDSGDHVTAEDLSATVQRRFPSVDVSTVYRTLDVLEELRIVDHVHLAHGPAIFHLVEDDHQHLVCEQCGLVRELPVERMNAFARMLKRDFGFELPHRHFAIVGLCEACRQA